MFKRKNCFFFPINCKPIGWPIFERPIAAKCWRGSGRMSMKIRGEKNTQFFLEHPFNTGPPPTTTTFTFSGFGGFSFRGFILRERKKEMNSILSYHNNIHKHTFSRKRTYRVSQKSAFLQRMFVIILNIIKQIMILIIIILIYDSRWLSLINGDEYLSTILKAETSCMVKGQNCPWSRYDKEYTHRSKLWRQWLYFGQRP